MWTEQEELNYFQRQGYRLTDRRQALFYFSFTYTKRMEPWPPLAETFYIVEATINQAFHYTFWFNSEEEARQHKPLPTSHLCTLYNWNQDRAIGIEVASLIEGSWREAPQYG